MTAHHTFCRICESLCGLEVDVEDGRVVRIRPDARHVATSGFACVKGMEQHHLFGSPDRLEHPLRRRPDGTHEHVPWDEALGGIGRTVRRVRRRHGPHAIAMYVGTAAGFSVLHPIFAQGFMTGVGSRSMFATATQDCANKFAVARHVYGFPFTQPFPDLRHTECLIIVGANPAVSKWSFLQVTNPIKQLRALEARGASLFVVDPRRTESARAAGEHVFIRPGTDVFFYLAFLHEILARDAIDHPRVAAHMRGLEALRELAADWTPERVAPVTRILPDTLRRMVDAYVRADGASLYCSTGVNMGKHGALAFWLQESINAISGNLDRRGGTLVGRGIVDFPRVASRFGVLLRDDRSRVGDLPMVNDALPGGVLADEISTPGRDQIRALFVTGGNPLLTMSDAAKLRRAFRKLELLVVLDILPSETAAIADYVLPCTSPLQRPDLPFIFPLMLGLQTTPYLQATRAVESPRGEQRDEASIYLQLARACGVSLFGSRLVQRGLELAARRARGRVPQEAMLSGLLRATGHGSFARLLGSPHGRRRPDHAPGSFLGSRVLTPSRKVELAPPELLESARGLERSFADEDRDRRRLRLITKRAVTTHNSWTHNHPRFVQGDRDTNYVYMHPDDAATAGLAELDLADVSSDTATIRLPVRLLEELPKCRQPPPPPVRHTTALRYRREPGSRRPSASRVRPPDPGCLENL